MRTTDRKKGSAEFLILSLLQHESRHGYEISKLIESRSGGVVQFQVSSLYPLLYRMEKRGWIRGKWVEKAGQRRRRYYSITPTGRGIVGEQRPSWLEFVRAIGQVAGVTHA
ncbi:MAG: PadR family transcriptional regulator [Gemmatimonadaceae bacterium]